MVQLKHITSPIQVYHIYFRTYCGDCPPPVITSSDNALTVPFRSDLSISHEGVSDFLRGLECNDSVTQQLGPWSQLEHLDYIIKKLNLKDQN